MIQWITSGGCNFQTTLTETIKAFYLYLSKSSDLGTKLLSMLNNALQCRCSSIEQTIRSTSNRDLKF